MDVNLLQILADNVANYPMQRGDVDICCYGPTKNASSRCATYAAHLLGYRNSEGAHAITKFVVVVPPDYGDTDQLSLQIQSLIEPFYRQETGDGLTEMSSVVRLVQSESLLAEALQSMLRTLPQDVAAIVWDASRYRYFLPKEMVSWDKLNPWIPHAYELVRRLLCDEPSRPIYVLLDTGRWMNNISSELSVRIEALEGANVIRGVPEGESIDPMSFMDEEWASLLEAGRLGTVLERIEGLESASATEKNFIKARSFHRANMEGNALQIMEELSESCGTFHYTMNLVLAQMASRSSRHLSSRFLSFAIDQLDSAETLNFAINISEEIEDTGAMTRILARYLTLFPESPAVRRSESKSLARSGDYARAAQLLEGDHEESSRFEMYKFLSSALPHDRIPNYSEVRREIAMGNQTWAPQALRAIVLDALRRKLLMHALEVLIAKPPAREGYWQKFDLELELIELFLLHYKELDQINDQLVRLSISVIRYLSARPDDAGARVRFARVLSPSSSGDLGLPVILASILEIAGEAPLDLQPRADRTSIGADGLAEMMPEIQSAIGWLKSEGSMVLGRATIPSHMISAPIDKLLPALEQLIIRLGHDIKDDDDVQTLMLTLIFGTAVSAHASYPLWDIVLLRHAACQLAMASRTQQARDLAEQALIIARTDPRRCRSAWLAMADTYHRAGNRHESLIAIGCALAGDRVVDAEQAWYEVFLLSRLFRDTELYEDARTFLRKAKDLLEYMGDEGANRNRHELAELLIDFREVDGDVELARQRLPEILRRAALNARNSLETEELSGPAAIFLGQCILVARELGCDVPSIATETMAALSDNVAPSLAELYSAVTTDRPSLEAVFALYKSIDGSRYSEDVAFDNHSLEVVAHRLLSSPALTSIEAIFGIDLISDRAVATPGWVSTSKPPDKWRSATAPAEFAKELSRRGISLLFLGRSSRRQVVGITAVQGVTSIEGSQAREFSYETFHEWQKTFPFAYGISESPNLFYVSTEGLKPASLPDGPTVVIADVELQQFPPNLLRCGDTFAGMRQPMSAAPSLSWLAAAVKNAVLKPGHRAAWISSAETKGTTLAQVIDRVSSTLEQHGVVLDTSHQLPQGMSGSELAIVVAHGSLDAGEDYFQRVSDEGQVTALGADLAHALKGAGIVLLFVCNGGRTDKHPLGTTTIGLARQILDSGCSAVVGSPWPMDSRVPSYWLGAFLEAWDAGETVAQASFVANEAVAKRFNDNPADCLAMTVYGNPLVKLVRA